MSRPLVFSHWPELAVFFAHFVPIDVRADLMADTIEYHGFSMLFREVPEGGETPVYKPTFRKIGAGTVLISIE